MERGGRAGDGMAGRPVAQVMPVTFDGEVVAEEAEEWTLGIRDGRVRFQHCRFERLAPAETSS